MKYRSITPLNSAADAGVRVQYHAISAEARRLLDQMGVPPDATLFEAKSIIESRLRFMGLEQRRQTLVLMGQVLRQETKK